MIGKYHDITFTSPSSYSGLCLSCHLTPLRSRDNGFLGWNITFTTYQLYNSEKLSKTWLALYKIGTMFISQLYYMEYINRWKALTHCQTPRKPTNKWLLLLWILILEIPIFWQKSHLEMLHDTRPVLGEWLTEKMTLNSNHWSLSGNNLLFYICNSSFLNK